jgi:hypothetical protein
MSYTWTYTVKETDNVGYNLWATAKDVAGNAATAAATGSVALDGVAPVVGNAALNPARVAKGGQFTLTFDVSETPGADPTVAFSNGVDAPITMTKSSNTGLSYAYAGTAPDTGSAPFYSVTVSVNDAAGNGTVASAGTVEIDNVAPELSGLEVAPAGAKVGDTIRIVLTADETLSGPPTLTATTGVTTVTFSVVDGTAGKISYSYTLAVTGAAVQGIYTIQPFDIVDVAGNTRNVTPNPAKTFSIDSSVPVVQNVASDKAKYSRVAGYNRVTLTFDCTENVGGGLLVNIGGNTMTCDAFSAAAPNYTCRYDIQPADTAGIKSVNIQAMDAAGNAGFGSASVEYDFAGPTVTSSSGSPNPVGIGKTLVYTLNASEPLLGNPVLHPTPAIAFSGPTQSGTLYTWTRTIDGTETQGTYAVTGDVTDLAGNQTNGAAAAGFTVDSVLPGIATGPTLNKSPAFYRVGDTVTVTFTTNEDLDAALPTAMLNTTTAVNLPCVAGGGTNDYTCPLGRNLAAADLPEGQVSVSISLRDAAQNTGFGSVNLTLDYTNPALVSATPSQAYYRGGQTIAYTVSVSEPLSGSPGRPTVRVYKDGSLQTGYFGNPSSETDTSFTYTKAVMADGDYSVEVDLTDKAGNAVTNTGSPVGWTIDATAPTVTPVSVLTDNPYDTTLAKSGEIVTAKFTASETLSGNPTVTVGGAVLGFVSNVAGLYTYQRPTVHPGDTDGVKTVTVTATDPAGNVKVQDIGSVTYDFTAPYLADGGAAEVQIFPAPGSLVVPSAVTFGAKARITFTVSEGLKPYSVPMLTWYPSDGDWTVIAGNDSNFWHIDMTLNGGGPIQGVRWATVVLTDVAGNISPPIVLMLPADQLNVDTIAPAPITVAQNDRILYRRIPWGSDATSGVKTFTVGTTASCGPGTEAVEPGATVIFWDDDDIATAAEIGRKTADGNGCFAEKELNRADRVNVYLTQVDSAGNIDSTTATAVKNVEWTATMGYKVPGSIFENPHSYTMAPVFARTLYQDPDSAREPWLSEIPELGLLDADSLSRTGDGIWRIADLSGTKPSARGDHALVYDSAKGRLVLFGGDDGSKRNDSWEWDGSAGTWNDRTPEGTKPARGDGYAVYDSSRGRLVLARGIWDSQTFETWEWDGATSTWIDRSSEGTSPPYRSGHALSYDSTRRKVVMFGGYDGAGYLQDTWEWDGTAGTWNDRTSAGSKPSGRYSGSMAHDASRGKVVLFGGSDAGGRDDETWEWDGVAGTWTDRTPAVTKPSARRQHSMTYDASRQKVVLFGGNDGSYKQDTWEWDGTAGTWTNRTTGGTKPPERAGHAIGYDALRERVVLFGGFGASTYQDIWEWDGVSGTWSERTPVASTPPEARYHPAMAYDTARSKAVMFGGGKEDGTYLQDTWEWDGALRRWIQRAAGLKPSKRFAHAMAFDAGRGRTVLFGGFDGANQQDTWEWDGAAGSWTNRTPAGAKPTARTGHAMAYDGARARVVLFGGGDGSYLQDMWEWDGTAGTWTDRTPGGSNPPGRAGHAMAYDVSRGKVVLFGGWSGSSDLQDTWEWDGVAGTWTDRTMPGTKPQARNGHAMVFDTVRGRTVVFGGASGSERLQDTWEWDGVSGTWTDRTPAGAKPERRKDHVMVFDTAQGKAVMFGGDTFMTPEETWEWDGGLAAYPGQLFGVGTYFTGASTPTWVSLTATFQAGGTGYPGAVATNGVDLLAWEDGAWMGVASNTSSLGAPGLVQWTTTDTNEIARTLFGPQQTLNFAVTPSAPNGTGTGEVAVDYAEVTVKYRQQ